MIVEVLTVSAGMVVFMTAWLARILDGFLLDSGTAFRASPILWLTLVIPLAAVVILVLFFRKALQKVAVARGGLYAQAVVLAKRRAGRSRAGGDVWDIEFGFRSRSGERESTTIRVFDPDHVAEGQSCALLYDPDEPGNVLIEPYAGSQYVVDVQGTVRPMPLRAALHILVPLGASAVLWLLTPLHAFLTVFIVLPLAMKLVRN